LAALAVYMLVSLLSMGAMSQADLASLKNPSMAGVLEQVVGPWGSALVSIGVVISVGGAFLSWPLLAAEIPFVAAKDGTMPRFFAGENAKGSPATSLWITNGFVQIFLIVAYYYQSTYQALFYIASTAILVPYVFSGAYALKLALSGEAYRAAESRMRDVVLGLIATLYGAWLVYAAGPAYLLMCALLYAPGILLYWFARRERSLPAFRPLEVALAVGLVAAAIVAAFMMYRGAISPL
jgi:arginine:ornithine antiporter/lysine permease